MPRKVPPPTPPHMQDNALPWGDIVLADGRTLRFVGAVPPNLRPPNTVDSGNWLSADGLQVVATLTRHGDHYLRHVSVAYRDRRPTERDVQAVQHRFFAPHQRVERLEPQRDGTNDLNPHCIHLEHVPDPPARTVTAA